MLATNTKQAGGMAPGQLGDAHTVCWAGYEAALPSRQALNPHRPQTPVQAQRHSSSSQYIPELRQKNSNKITTNHI